MIVFYIFCCIPLLDWKKFCGNDPKTMLDAALLAQDHCDGIDINLGCPQAIAKRGHYGAFLQDEWELLHNIGKYKYKFDYFKFYFNILDIFLLF